MNTIYMRAFVRFLIGAAGAFIANGANEPQTGWEWSVLCAGALVSGLTGFEAFISRASGLEQPKSPSTDNKP